MWIGRMNDELDASDYNLIEIMPPYFLEGTEKEDKQNCRRRTTTI
jgi:hypothetical protein